MKLLMMVLMVGLIGCDEGFVVNDDELDDAAVMVGGNIVVDEVDEVTVIDEVEDITVAVEVDVIDDVIIDDYDDYDDCIIFNGVCAYIDKGDKGDYHCSDDTKATRNSIENGNLYIIEINKCNTITSVKLFSDLYMLENTNSNTLIEVVKTIPAIDGTDKTVTIRYSYNGLVFYSNEVGADGVIAIHKYSFVYGEYFITKENIITGDIRIITSMMPNYTYILRDVRHEFVINQVAHTI